MEVLADILSAQDAIPEPWRPAGWRLELEQGVEVMHEVSGDVFACKCMMEKRGVLRFIAPLGAADPSTFLSSNRYGRVAFTAWDMVKVHSGIYAPYLLLTVQFTYLGPI